MSVVKTEQLVMQLLARPDQPLATEQKELAFKFALGLFEGRLAGVVEEVGLTLEELQTNHALSQKQTFYIDYFQDEAGKQDVLLLGLRAEATLEEIRRVLLDIDKMQRLMSATARKEMASRGADWCRSRLVSQLANRPETDADFMISGRVAVNYQPARLLEKASGVYRFRQFYRQVGELLESEPDALLAKAEQVLLDVHVARLNAMAAVDVYPGLLSFEEQLHQMEPSDQVSEWLARLAESAPIIAKIHDLPEEDRQRAREVYVRHLDAIRQGAPFELDEVDDSEVFLFNENALNELVQAIESHTNLADSTLGDLEQQRLAAELEATIWDAWQVKAFAERILDQWDMLSRYQHSWRQVDDRNGFAPDNKYQVIVTPKRINMSVDSTRRIMNIPEDFMRPLVATYPAGVLPILAHELSHVLQSYADYELGEQIPLAKIKGRRYRILREAGGVYQERMFHSRYLGQPRSINIHYLRAYQAKVSGASRASVARTFYESTANGRELTEKQEIELRTFAVDRTARLYRRGGHNSQVLDYVEQSIVCDMLMERMEPEQVDAFLLGSTSFSLEDSAALHRYGLLNLPNQAPINPAEVVMDTFERDTPPVKD